MTRVFTNEQVRQAKTRRLRQRPGYYYTSDLKYFTCDELESERDKINSELLTYLENKDPVYLGYIKILESKCPGFISDEVYAKYLEYLCISYIQSIADQKYLQSANLRIFYNDYDETSRNQKINKNNRDITVLKLKEPIAFQNISDILALFNRKIPKDIKNKYKYIFDVIREKQDQTKLTLASISRSNNLTNRLPVKHIASFLGPEF